MFTRSPAALIILGLAIAACAPPRVPVLATAPAARAPIAPAPPTPPASREIVLAEQAALEAVAREVLTAWASRDVERLAALGPPGAASRLIFLEVGSDHWRALFADDAWTMRAVQAWDGQLRGVERGLDAAWVIFREEPGWRYAVELHRFGERWGLHHLRQLQRPDRRGLTVNEPAPLAEVQPGPWAEHAHR